MRFLIIGLGIYGSNLARDLTDMGHQVIGADSCQSNVDAIKDYISTVYLIDATEETQLEVLPLRNVDLVIVAIGENFGASIKTVALMKKAGVEHIYARAIDDLHEAILRSFEIDRILTPEQRAAADLVQELQLGGSVTTLSVDDENLVITFATPEFFLGLAYDELSRKLKHDYGISLVAVTRPVDKTNVLGVRRPEVELLPIDTTPVPSVQRADRLTVFASRKALRDLYRKAF